MDSSTLDEWKSQKLPKLITDYEPRNICNADETVFFLCKCEPDISLHFKGDLCHDEKRSKDSVTVLHGANIG